MILACAGGFSTSMLVERMKEAAAKQKIDVVIDAVAESKIAKIIDEVDVILLGPQVGHMEGPLKQKYQEKNVKISTIPSIDYGMMNGEKVLNDALNQT